MNCLGIPIPICVQELLREPPACSLRAEDDHALDRIRQFGAELGRPSTEINQACNLASGPSDLVMILERPSPGQNYNMSFDEFVRECETLKAVDNLIKFSSKGARSIHTVTVLDAFSFSPRRYVTTNDAGCHQLIQDILNLKRPKVVLCCWQAGQGRCRNQDVSPFMSLGVGTWPLWERVNLGSWRTNVVRSFHPSAAVNYRSRSPHSRMLLICHFVLAFAELVGQIEVPPWIGVVCDEASRLVSPIFDRRLDSDQRR